MTKTNLSKVIKSKLMNTMELSMICLQAYFLILTLIELTCYITLLFHSSAAVKEKLIGVRQNAIQRVPALRAFWDLEKSVLHEIRVSGTVLWSPTNANSPTYTYISQKTC